MTRRPTKRRLQSAIEDLREDVESDQDAGHRVTIRSCRVDESGEPTEVFSRLEVWEDENGEHHSERTVYDEGEGPDP